MIPSCPRRSAHRAQEDPRRALSGCRDRALENWPETASSPLETDSSAGVGWGFRRNVRQQGVGWAARRRHSSFQAPVRAGTSPDERFRRQLPCRGAASPRSRVRPKSSAGAGSILEKCQESRSGPGDRCQRKIIPTLARLILTHSRHNGVENQPRECAACSGSRCC